MAKSGHEALWEKVKANGRFLFFCREMDYERILEAVYEVEREISLKDQEIEEEEMERGREEPGLNRSLWIFLMGSLMGQSMWNLQKMPWRRTGFPIYGSIGIILGVGGVTIRLKKEKPLRSVI